MNLKDKAYEIIKEKIVSCQVLPGEFLVEAQLMEEVGASRTPIREALNKLEQENLVEILPKRGVQVSPVTLGTLTDIYEVRQLVEPYILSVYGKELSQDTLTALRQDVAAQDWQEEGLAFYQLDDRFHNTLMSGCKNQVLRDVVDSLYAHNQRLRILSSKKRPQRREETQQEHLVIIDHLLAQRYNEAADAMTQHLKQSRHIAISNVLSGDVQL